MSVYRVKKLKRRLFKKKRPRDELRLKKSLKNFLRHRVSAEATTEDDLFKVLLPIRWSIYGLTYNHIVLDRTWKWKDFFLELPDFIAITASNNELNKITMEGAFVWWAEGKDAVGKWWTADRVACVQDFGEDPLEVFEVDDLEKGGFLIEPFEVVVWPNWNKRRGAEYSIQFGKGSTFMQYTNTTRVSSPSGSRSLVGQSEPTKKPVGWDEAWEATFNSSQVKIHGAY